MAPTNGKLEHLITVPTGGWDTTVGGVTKTVAAGSYYISSPGSGSRSFIEEVEYQFGASSVSISASESGTGIVTIVFSGATAIAWVDTEVRDLLGFTADSASATTHVGTLSARGIWLPHLPPLRHNAGGYWRGYDESDYRSVSNAAGHVWVRSGQRRTILDPLIWRGLKQEYTWRENESTAGSYTNKSIQTFWRDGVWGEAAWGTPGGPVRFYPDASVDTAYGTYRLLDSDEFRPEPMVEGWIGLWTWRMPRMVQVPGSEASGLGGTSRATQSTTHHETSSSTDNTTGYTTGSITPTASRLQTIAILSSESTTAETPTSVVGCGLTWVLIPGAETYCHPSAVTRRLSVWRARGSSPTTGTLTITFANAMTSCLWSWSEHTNADTSGLNGSGAIVQVVTSTAAGGSSTMTNTLAALEHSTNVHYAALGVAAGDTITADADFTEIGKDTEATPASSIGTQRAANQTAVTPTWTSASAGCISIEIKSGTT